MYFLSRLRPKLQISPFIAFSDDEKGKYYVFKIINKTPRPIINIKCRLTLVTPKSVPGGLVFTNEPLKLQREETFSIDKFDKKDKDANYAWRFVCREDIGSAWEEKNGSYLIFRVLATDSLSSLSKYFSQRYFTKRDCLRHGSHRFGNNLSVE